MQITDPWYQYTLSDLFMYQVERTATSQESGSPVTGFANPCIGYILDGTGEFTAGDTKFSLHPGDVVYIPKGQIYVSRWHSARFYSLNFSFSRERGNRNLFAFTARSVPHIRPEMDTLFHAVQAKDPLKTLSTFYSILNTLAEYFPAQENRNLGVLEPALDYLDESCIEPLSVPQLARLCRISESGFYAKFHAAMGMTPAEYRNTLLVQKAVSMLFEGELTVEQISDRLGFSSPAYFRRVFHHITGESPKEVRQRGMSL